MMISEQSDQIRAIDQSGNIVDDQYSVTSTGGGLFAATRAEMTRPAP